MAPWVQALVATPKRSCTYEIHVQVSRDGRRGLTPKSCPAAFVLFSGVCSSLLAHINDQIHFLKIQCKFSIHCISICKKTLLLMVINQACPPTRTSRANQQVIYSFGSASGCHCQECRSHKTLIFHRLLEIELRLLQDLLSVCLQGRAEGDRCLRVVLSSFLHIMAGPLPLPLICPKLSLLCLAQAAPVS